MQLEIHNRGAKPIRVVQKNSLEEVQIQPNEQHIFNNTEQVLELRELGNVQQPPGQVEAP